MLIFREGHFCPSPTKIGGTKGPTKIGLRWQRGLELNQNYLIFKFWPAHRKLQKSIAPFDFEPQLWENGETLNQMVQHPYITCGFSNFSKTGAGQNLWCTRAGNIDRGRWHIASYARMEAYMITWSAWEWLHKLYAWDRSKFTQYLGRVLVKIGLKKCSPLFP